MAFNRIQLIVVGADPCPLSKAQMGRCTFPTIWLEREQGVSNFKVASWIPGYLRWYRFAFGRRLTLDELEQKLARDRERF